MPLNRRALLLGSTGLAATWWCGPAVAADTHAAAARAKKLARKTASLSVLYPSGSLGNLLPIARQFEAQSGIRIDLVEGSLDEISAELILQQKLGAKRFDVAVAATFGVPDLVEANTIRDLTDFARQHQPESFTTSLYPLGDTYQNKLYGYQTDGDCYLMFYNRDRLESSENQKRYSDRFGQALAIPRTWEELDRQIEFFHHPDQQQYGGCLYRNQNYTAWEFWVRFHAQGYFPFGEGMQCVLDNDVGVQVLEQMRATTENLSPTVLQNGLFENFRSFASGKGYCNIGWGGTQKYLNGNQSAIKGRVAYAPLPGGNLATPDPWLPFFNWGWNFVVPQTTHNAELAYLFCLFATSPQPSTQAVREDSGYFDPFHDVHYADSTIEDIYSSEFLKQHRYSMTNAFPDLYIRGRGLYFETLRQGIYLGASGMAEPRQILAKVAARWERITDELGRSEQQAHWLSLKQQYPPALAKALI